MREISGMAITSPGLQHYDTFICHIEGLPLGLTWQRLMSIVGQQAQQQLHVDTMMPQDCSNTGWVRTHQQEQAESLYDLLTSNSPDNFHLNITLWIISDCSGEPRLLKSNHNLSSRTDLQLRQLAQISKTNVWQSWAVSDPEASLSPVAVSPQCFATNGEYLSRMGDATGLMLPTYRYVPAYQHYQHDYESSAQAFSYQTSTYALQPQYHTSRSPQPAYGHPSDSTSIHANDRLGTILTESRGIFVKGLHWDATAEQVKAHFSMAGKIDKFELLKDKATKRSQGKAVIRYFRKEDARRAIQLFNGKMWMKRCIYIRFDKEELPVADGDGSSPAAEGASSPLIVNGSGNSAFGVEDSGALRTGRLKRRGDSAVDIVPPHLSRPK